MKITSDNQEELFDVVDEKDEIIGLAKRGEVHLNPRLMHRSVGVVVFNKKGEIFLQKRSISKDVDPGKWTISCSGHVGAKRVLSRLTPIKYSSRLSSGYASLLGVPPTVSPVNNLIK